MGLRGAERPRVASGRRERESESLCGEAEFGAFALCSIRPARCRAARRDLYRTHSATIMQVGQAASEGCAPLPWRAWTLPPLDTRIHAGAS